MTYKTLAQYKTFAVCLKCGSEKQRAGLKCKDCGFCPKTDVDYAQSLELSTEGYFFRPKHKTPYDTEFPQIWEQLLTALQQQGRDIRNGATPVFNEKYVNRHVGKAKRSRKWIKRHWFIVVLWLGLISIPLLWVIFVVICISCSKV